MKTVLTIAGSDPSSGAGLQADLKIFQSLEVHGVTAVTAITAQTDKKFVSLHSLPSNLLNDQLECLVERYKIDAVKIGMLGTAENVLAVYHFLKKAKINKIILDPVMKSSTGVPLLNSKGVILLKDLLVSLATVVTPNLDELEVLTKIKAQTVDQMKEAARYIYENYKGVKGILVKGGHLKGEATDVFYDGHAMKVLKAKKKFPKEVHGTGCMLSAAVAANLALGNSLEKAVEKAKEFVTDLILKS